MIAPWYHGAARHRRSVGGLFGAPEATRNEAAPGTSRNRGQALVEFALILPVFLLLTLGVVDGARIFTSNVALTNGVREAALFASQGKSYLDTAQINAIVGLETSGFDTTRLVVNAPQCDGVACTSTGVYTNVNITATYSVDLFVTSLPGVGTFWPNPLPMRATTTARIIK
jgi:Flp pilus assembly protein TadG